MYTSVCISDIHAIYMYMPKHIRIIIIPYN